MNEPQQASRDRPQRSADASIIHRAVGAEPGELRPAILCGVWFFLILYSFFIMRPMREAAGIQGGVEDLPVLFLATMLAMLLVNPIFATFVASSRRNRFVPGTYLFFSLNTVAFAVLFAVVAPERLLLIGRIFYVWLSVLNLFAVSIFWAVMADAWRGRQGRRLFGFLGVGGTLGAIAGAATTNQLTGALSRPALFAIAAAGLAVSAILALLVLRAAGVGPAPRSRRTSAMQAGAEPGRGALAGRGLLATSPDLLGVGLYVLLYTILSTFVYFLQASIVEAQFAGREERTAFFALLDVASQSVTLFVQLFLTGRLIRWLGVAWALATLPLLTLAGLLALGLVIQSGHEGALIGAGVLWTFFVFQVLRRGLNYALAKPCRELLFTATTPQEKYGAKPIIDTFIYRTGDAVGALAYGWMGAGLQRPFVAAGLGLGAGAIALYAAPLAGLWIVSAVGLGFAYQRRSRRIASAETPPEPPGPSPDGDPKP